MVQLYSCTMTQPNPPIAHQAVGAETVRLLFLCVDTTVTSQLQASIDSGMAHPDGRDPARGGAALRPHGPECPSTVGRRQRARGLARQYMDITLREEPSSPSPRGSLSRFMFFEKRTCALM